MSNPFSYAGKRVVVTGAATGVGAALLELLAEMQELVLHFAAYSGWPKGSFLDQVVRESWERVESEGGITPG